MTASPHSPSRRHFMSMLGAGAASLSIAPLLLRAPNASAAPSFGAGFGPISPRLPLNSDALFNASIGDLRGKAILSLPEGFDYWIVSPTGDALSDGVNLVPGAHDGMAAFRGPSGSTILVRNHELTSSGIRAVVPSGALYDPTRFGGTTTLVLDAQGHLVSHVGSLAGTERNCAGGLTPWDSWLTC